MLYLWFVVSALRASTNVVLVSVHISVNTWPRSSIPTRTWGNRNFEDGIVYVESRIHPRRARNAVRGGAATAGSTARHAGGILWFGQVVVNRYGRRLTFETQSVSRPVGKTSQRETRVYRYPCTSSGQQLLGPRLQGRGLGLVNRQLHHTNTTVDGIEQCLGGFGRRVNFLHQFLRLGGADDAVDQLD